MAEFFSENILPLFGTLLVGVAGYFTINPIRRFYRLREKAHETIQFTANVFDPEKDEERYKEAHTEIRRLAAQLGALVDTASWPVRWYFRRCDYRPKDASAGLYGLSNTLSNRSGERAANQWDVEKALKLPLCYDTRPAPRDNPRPRHERQVRAPEIDQSFIPWQFKSPGPPVGHFDRKEYWDENYMEVRFKLILDGLPISCRVTYEALEDSIGGTNIDPLKVFTAHREEWFFPAVDRKLKAGLFEGDGSILITSTDYLG